MIVPLSSCEFYENQGSESHLLVNLLAPEFFF